MLRITNLQLPLDHPPEALRAAAAQALGIEVDEIRDIQVFKRSYDARQRRRIVFIYTLHVVVNREDAILRAKAHDSSIRMAPDTHYHPVARVSSFSGTPPIVVGLGPCGIFAALLLAQMGFRPLVLERGKEVRERSEDTFSFWKGGPLNAESNVQFGEGGAGTFSDGKLYSRIKDPKNRARKVLEELVEAGAPEEILYLSKPHIGTYKLVSVVRKIRETILRLGGEIRFGARVEDLVVEGGQLRGVRLPEGETVRSDRVILAVGHSARDTFEMLHRQRVDLEAKEFSIGLRIEHPQGLIDRCRFGPNAGHPKLGSADYKLVHHGTSGRSVYSFCMCPGGTVVAATSEPGCVVTNGMSQFSRSERNANSALVVGISPKDYPGTALAGIEFQRRWERKAFEAAENTYRAPAQKVGDFLKGRPSRSGGEVQPSYSPGVHWTDLSTCLPDYATAALREAIPTFDRQIRGFAMDEAVLTGVETRTSSPLRISRGADFQSTNLEGLYPAGEGAGYAGGILSSAVDGIKVAEAVALAIQST